MPELPEVQTTVDDLNKKIRHRRIVGTWHDWPKFKAVKKSEGHTVKEVKRVGKNILIYFTDSHILLIHMKMTGHLLMGKWLLPAKKRGGKITPISPKEIKERVNDFIHFILVLDNGQMIGFSDMRKFGKVAFGKLSQIESLPELIKLGPDALEVDYKNFINKVKKRTKTIYQALLDQTVLAGLGNIYVNDVLWKAGVHPLKKSNQLTDNELKRIYSAIKPILKKALKMRGTSTSDYRDVAGLKGRYGDVRLAYQRKECGRCRAKIVRVKQGGRSIHYCPKCQGK